MTTAVRQRQRATFFLILASFVGTHLYFWLLPGVFEIWNARVIDQLYVLRSMSEKYRPAYDHTVVHVDLNNTSLRNLENHYLDRSHFAEVVQNLTAMKVAAQAYDFIFAARLSGQGDKALIDEI